ncbi:MAG: single-stranded DNA-binding protein [Clostridiaceae bacterium]|jgi:single-strand DNA-binding protein|nr:single-stranded DNA-binding protein [Clostridiaceae bacterium]
MNKVIFMGRLTADPELRYTTGSNIPVCTFSIAVDRPFQKQGEERQADFFRIVAWRSTGEFASRYFRKGMRVLVEGSLRNNDYIDNQGVKRYSVDVQAERVYFADGKRDDAPGGFTQQPSYRTPAQQGAPAQQPESGDGFYPLSDDDDDLPF